ncbi:MAG: ABC transporter substrate-binding protein, partial [Anaerolineaceae bacterium]
MKTKSLVVISIIVILTMLLASCAKATPVATQAPAEATEAPMAEATEAPMTTDAPEIDCMGAASGDTISMLYQWSGVEEENLTKILAPLVEACGIVINPESTRDQALLDTRVQAGTPPDITFWNVTQLTQYETNLVAMTDLGVNGDNYADYWKSIGTVNGKWLGLPVKADPKTLIWYSPANFTADGYTIPTTWDELDSLVEKMVADGKIPWSLGMESGDATGWTGTDFSQDILLVTQGPAYVMGIIDGSIPYNDPGVKAAYEIYGKWAMSDMYTVGGSA